jgi:hypothetical protein
VRYIEAIEDYRLADDEISVFLAGGITDCPDWQADLRFLLKDVDLTILNPRRAEFDVRDPTASLKQIRWEHWALTDATFISFWFPRETLCPITLYELGAWSRGDKPILIGTHPEYKRRIDVEVQTSLVRPEVDIADSLGELAIQIKRTRYSNEVAKRDG